MLGGIVGGREGLFGLVTEGVVVVVVVGRMPMGREIRLVKVT